MPLHDEGERSAQRSIIERSGQPRSNWCVPRVGAGPQLLQEPQTPLGERERHWLLRIAARDRGLPWVPAAREPSLQQRPLRGGQAGEASGYDVFGHQRGAQPG